MRPRAEQTECRRLWAGGLLAGSPQMVPVLGPLPLGNTRSGASTASTLREQRADFLLGASG